MKEIKRTLVIAYVSLSSLIGVGQTENDFFDSKAIENNKIFLLGETHGIKSNFIIAKEMMYELKEKTNFRYFLAETDFAVGLLLNEAINKKDTSRIKEIVLSYGVSPSRCVEKYEFYKYIIELNEQFEDDIQILGIDIAAAGAHFSKEVIKKTKDTFTQDYLRKNWENTKIAFGVPDRKWNATRDAFMIENFKTLVKEYSIEDEVFFGVWGYQHIYKSESQGVKWLASGLMEEGKKVHSTVQYYIDSIELDPWHFYHKKPNGKCFYKKRWTNVRGSSLKNYKKELKDGAYKVVKDVTGIKTNNFIQGNEDDKNLKDYLDALIIVKKSGPTTVLGSNVCENP